MLKKLHAALGALMLTLALWPQLALAQIATYPPSYGNGVLDVTNLNSTIAAVNNLTGHGTPQGGTFTTLSASSTVSGAGFTARFASPGPVGSTAASTGAFTTLSATTQLLLSGEGTPTIASGACGTGTNGTIASGSTDQSGQVQIGSATTTTCTIAFSATLGTAPGACVLFPANATAAATGTTVAYVSAITTAHFVITGSALASANYYYHCI